LSIGLLGFLRYIKAKIYTFKMQLCLFSDIKNKALTPMMQQYLLVKAAYQEYLLFYRMGDFYELFFDDAIKGAEVMNITLTKRGTCHDKPIPMCGVPAHAYEQYLEKLIKAGCAVAVCEQLETPAEAKKRGHKAVVRREVTRVITPGTILEERLLPNKNTNYLCALANSPQNNSAAIALAWVDISTGEFYSSTTAINNLSSDFARLQPTEILISAKLSKLQEMQPYCEEYKNQMSPRADNIFDYNRAINTINNFFQIQSINSIGNFSEAEIIAIGALIEYLQYTQKEHLPKLRLPKQINNSNFLCIDSSTRRNLELEFDSSGQRANSLLSALDCTITNAGGRLLAKYLMMPLIDAQAIKNRLDAVEFFCNNPKLGNDISDYLRQLADIERILVRISTKRASPRDLGALRDSLDIAFKIFSAINEVSSSLPINVELQQRQLCGFEQLLDFLRSCLVNEPPLSIIEGNFIKPGFNATLDQLISLSNTGQAQIVKLMNEYRNITGIANLKITHNNILGYYIEITPGHAQKMNDSIFEHRQSLQTAIRYTTPALRQLESELITCDDRIMEQKFLLFADICENILKYHEQLLITSEALAYLDVATSMAILANKYQYVRPIIDNSQAFNIIGGRHPVVERRLSNNFVVNDCNLENEQKLWILTGPNMAGKSTFLRQNALIAIMAQIGSFVPAQEAHIGIVDKLFSRVGAADDISRGRSTFMVEMVETAAILNNATPSSLVILDEVGRGTATYDGLSIAGAVLEELQNISCRTLFATHYHELTMLEEKLANVSCYTIQVQEWHGKIIFMHKVLKGRADRSYGLHVAALAGLPQKVLIRADEILANFVDNSSPQVYEANTRQTVLPNIQPEILTKLKEMNLDNITALEALNILHEVKKVV
jgi:DNA mismatch repair protein MutS